MEREAANDHSVRLESLDFEGPLDLLVYLVQKNEVDIWDIPIATITNQFLEYIESMSREKLEGAGEFLLMAATLVRIKSQMLLPRPMLDDADVEDPRRELVLKIIEYQQFKEIAEHLREHEAAHRLVYPKGYPGWGEDPDADQPETAADREQRATLADLLRAFSLVMQEAARERVHRLEPIAVTVEEKIGFVREQLAAGGSTTFRELFVAGEPRAYGIVTFVALLEMAREGEIRLRQGDAFGEIYVYATGADDV